MSSHEVYSLTTDSISFMLTNGELKTKEADSSMGYGIRALEGGRLGFAYCQKESDLKEAIARAGRMSRFSIRSGFEFPGKAPHKAADIFDDEINTDDASALRSYVHEAKEGAESKGGKARIMLGVSRSHIGLENTSGMSGAYDKTGFSLYAECMHGDGFGLAYLGSCKRPASVRDLGVKAAEMASAMRGAKKPESGTYTVVMEPEALQNLIDTLMPSFSGDWKRRAITKLSIGAKRFSEKLTLCEDGLASGTDARPFDDEGTPSACRTLVEGGVVKSFLYDRETAAIEGVDESGACGRNGYDSSPSISSSNLVISPGDSSDLAEIGRHIELHYAHGSHTANPTTGDIGLEASAAFLVDKEKRTPLKGFMLSGNIFEMLSNIEAIEKKQAVLGSLICPRIAFKDLRIVS
jgi:PmbA protein